MSLTTIIWPVCAGISLSVAGIYLLVWLKSPKQLEYLAFTLSAFSATGLTLLELLLMHAQTPAEYGQLLRWMHVPAGVIVVSIVWFVYFYLQSGRLWLAWSISVLRAVVLVVNFVSGDNATFQSVDSLRSITFLGETLSLPDGVMHPWRVLIHLSVVLFLIYVLDASFVAFKRGKRRAALVLGSSIALAFFLSAVFSGLMVKGLLPSPLIAFLFSLIVWAMFFELSSDLIRVKQIATELEKNQARINLATRFGRIGIWEWDLAEDNIWANEVSLARLGVRPTDRINFQRILDSVHPDDREMVQKTVNRAIEHVEDLGVEFRLVSDGKERWLSLSGQLDFEKNQRPHLMHGVTVDITDQKKAELELLRQSSELTHMQRILTVGQLSLTLAHELNQPLGAILRNAEAGELFLNRPSPDLSEVQDILKDICKDVQRAASVIESMRFLLKKQEPRFEVLTLHEYVDQTLGMLRSETQAHHATIQLNIPPDLPKVMGDRVQLQQVLINLLMNSLDAIEGLPRERKLIVIRARDTGDGMITVEVIDQGKGIASEIMPRLFEPLMTSKEDGIGLGLAISKTIIDFHQGTLQAVNNTDTGARFSFSLHKADYRRVA
jgi:two-component system sensor kinase FixL